MNTPEEYIAAMQPKLCRDCEHLAKSSIGDSHSWKCMSPQNIISKDLDLVTGDTVVKRVYATCYDARTSCDPDQMGNPLSCGPNGAWFEARKFMEVIPVPGRPGAFTSVPRGVDAKDLLQQLDFMK